MKILSVAAPVLLASLFVVGVASQAGVNCAGDVTLNYQGDGGPMRVVLARDSTGPVVREIALSGPAGWKTVVANARPEFRVVSGLRRMTNQQLDPLAGLGIPITDAVMEKYKWEAFWDAPLHVPGPEGAHNNTTPPQRGVLGQPGLPRAASEISRGSAMFSGAGCTVKKDGSRIEVSFPGVTLGVFNGRLQYTFYKGTSLIKQEVIARTASPSVAYKYDAGLSGLQTTNASLFWNEVDKGMSTGHPIRGDLGPAQVNVRSTNRILTAQFPGGSISTFPPPHNFFWARETSYNLGYNWYQFARDRTMTMGVREAEGEEPPDVENRGTEDRAQNFALKSARPGTEQLMPVYFYVGRDVEAASRGAAAFTRNDQFKALPGYQVMAAHFHMNLVQRERAAGGLGSRVPDLEVLKAAGINIAAPIDGGGGFVASLAKSGDPAYNGDDPKWLTWSRGLGAVAGDPGRGGLAAPGPADPFAEQREYYAAATRQSSSAFVVMPNMEMIRGDITRELGGHTDVMTSHPVYWQQGKLPGQPFVAQDPSYGTVYRVETAKEFMEMVRRENLALFMPHPRTKGSTGYPDAIKDSAPFLDPNYRGAGFRWGMGLDGSERRLCEYRCLPLLDDMNNWVVGKNTPPKYLQAISELYQQGYGDDIYANNPVNYMKIGALPAPGDWNRIVNAFKDGNFFVTSGEVLITNFAVRGSGAARTVVADVEWTFPLDFVEVVWGNGKTTGRKIVRTTELPSFGTHHFEIPVSATGQAWIRFAAWDSAGNGAFVQPVQIR